MDESETYNSMWKKPDPEVNTLYDFIYLDFKNGKLIDGNRNQNNSCFWGDSIDEKR